MAFWAVIAVAPFLSSALCPQLLSECPYFGRLALVLRFGVLGLVSRAVSSLNMKATLLVLGGEVKVAVFLGPPARGGGDYGIGQISRLLDLISATISQIQFWISTVCGRCVCACAL